MTGMKPIDLIVGLLELVSEFAKIISFTFRLFGNIFAGMVLLFVMTFLIPFFVPLPFYVLEIFVGFMQAFVFAILTLIFMTMATISHEHAEEHH
jgi:F-type H+-transporting ATPase subunit a